MRTDPADPDRPTLAYSADRPEAHPRGVGGQIFLWVAVAIAAIFWGATMTTAVGIMESVSRSPAEFAPGASGLGYLVMDVIGVLALGLAIAYGAYRYHTRDRRLDRRSEAATARIYDKR